jgi:hypothetical protein
VNRNASTFTNETSRTSLHGALQRRTTYQPRHETSDNNSNDSKRYGNVAGAASTGNQKELYLATSQHLQQFRSVIIAATEPISMLSPASSVIPAHLSLLQPVYDALLNDFHPDRPVGVFAGDRTAQLINRLHSSIACCIRGLMHLSLLRIRVLDRAILSLLALYFGRLTRDNGLIAFSRSVYSTALQYFSSAMGQLLTAGDSGKSVTRIYQILVGAAVALQLFEHVSDVNIAGIGSLAHMDGALELLQRCGPDVLHASPALFEVFRGLRGVGVFRAIEQRMPGFLAEPLWQPEYFQHDNRLSFARDRLIDLALQVPALLENADNLIAMIQSEQHMPSRRKETISFGRSFRVSYSRLCQRFDGWMNDIHTQVPGPLYWLRREPLVLDVLPVEDPECKPRYNYPHIELSFSCGPIAGLLLHYWSFRLELSMSMIGVQKALESYHEKSRTGLDYHGDLKKTTARSLLEEEHRCEQFAQLILEACPYVGSCFEGLLAVQAPLRIAGRYYNQTKLDVVDDSQ